MAISDFYNKTVSTERMQAVSGSKRQEFSENLSSLDCHIQPIDPAQQQASDQGGFFRTFRMYFLSTAGVRRGDRVIDGADVYEVKGILSRGFGRNSTNKHKEALILLKE